MSLTPNHLKSELRAKLREEVKRHSAEERAAASARICERLLEQEVWQRARSVLFYYPMPDEPDVHSLFSSALKAGKIAVLPRYSKVDGHYQACQVADLERDLQIGTFGIHEPCPAAPIFDLKKLDLTLAPGIGFTLNGLRLGRGKGYYDRLLAQIPGCKCGVAFDWQVAFEIPTELHDIRVDCILTPTRWHETTGGAGPNI